MLERKQANRQRKRIFQTTSWG